MPTFRFDGSDLMPPRVQQAFWDAMARLHGDWAWPLDQALAQVEAAWASP